MQLTPGKKIKLSDLLAGIVKVDHHNDCFVTGIAIDSRKIQAGDLFLAYCGEVFDGHNFIASAITNGATAILCENTLPKLESQGTDKAQTNSGNRVCTEYVNNETNLQQSSNLKDNRKMLSTSVPIIVIPNLKNIIGLIAARFYDHPSNQLTIIGVTGTNGKTSITQFIASILTELNLPCGIIGTIGVGFPGKLSPLSNTTPDPVTLQKILYNFKKEGAKAIAMEVSSHSLSQHRIIGINFKIAIFSNLTRDHLDYHGTMENYGAAKKMLFMQPGLQYAIINADDDFGKELIKELKAPIKTYACTSTNSLSNVPTISAQPLKLDINGISAQVTTPWGIGSLNCRLLGKFNLDNLLAVLAVLGIMKVDIATALSCMKKLQTSIGRMQTLGGDKKPLVVIDYAHTPDALAQSLLALRECCHGALWCVFGCGGERDRGKRPIMGQIAERYGDHIIITNDNPRTENPQQIITDILQGLLCPWAAEIEQDRRAAIAHAIDCARANDVILIAGKGHEEYQIIGKDKLHFNDKEVVEKILSLKLSEKPR